MTPKPRNGRWRYLPAVLATVLLVGPSALADEAIDDLRRQREAARDAAATAVADLELLVVEDEEVAGALVEMQASVDAQIARVEGAQQALVASEAEVRARETAVLRSEATIRALEAEVAGQAVAAFVGASDTAYDWLASGDLNETAIRLSLIGFASGTDRDALDELRRVVAEREQHLLAGERARAEADARRLEVEAALASLQDRIEIKLAVQEELRHRIAEWEQAATDRAREAEELTELIRRTQVEQLGFELGDPGASSVSGFVMPVAGSIGSGFGSRRHPIFGSTRMHNGVDISGESGQPVWAAKEGVVIYAGWRGGYGNTILVQHEGDVVTLYAHLLEIGARVGDWVPGREVIGSVGSTGWSTGPHLHLEIRRDGTPEDPELYLPV